MVEVYTNILVETFMMECGPLIEKMVKDYFTMQQQEPNMMGIGKKI